MEKLLELSKSILRRGGYDVKEIGEGKENVFISSTLRPFVFMDLGYDLFNSVKVTFACKKWYNMIDREWKRAFRLFHLGMSEEELFLLSDFEDKMHDEMSAYVDKLVAAAENDIADVPEEYRKDIAKIFVSESIALVCNTFIHDGFHLGEREKSKEYFGIKGNFLGVITPKKNVRPLNDFSQMCKCFENTIVSYGRLGNEMVKVANNGKTVGGSLKVGESDEFMEAFNTLLEQYLLVTI